MKKYLQCCTALKGAPGDDCIQSMVGDVLVPGANTVAISDITPLDFFFWCSLQSSSLIQTYQTKPVLQVLYSQLPVGLLEQNFTQNPCTPSTTLPDDRRTLGT